MGDRIALSNALQAESAKFNRVKWEKASGVTEWLAGCVASNGKPRQLHGVS